MLESQHLDDKQEENKEHNDVNICNPVRLKIKQKATLCKRIRRWDGVCQKWGSYKKKKKHDDKQRLINFHFPWFGRDFGYKYL